MVPPPPPPPYNYNHHAWNANTTGWQSVLQTQHHNQHQRHHRVAPPPPPPPPQHAATVTRPAAPPVQSVSVHHLLPASIPVAPKVTFLINDNDSRSGPAKNLNALSPKLQSFFQGTTGNSQTIQRDDTNHPQMMTPYRGGTSNDENDESVHLFSPTQLLDASDDSSVTLLHSIFSPKFHAQSAKKKKKRSNSSLHHQDEQQHQVMQEHGVLRGGRGGEAINHHHSIFSPVSTGSTTIGGRIDVDDANDNSMAMSEMSDEFSTIHAILRGETVDSIKKLVGLDRANHPLFQSKSEGNDAVGMGTSNSNVTSTTAMGHCEYDVESKYDGTDQIVNDNANQFQDLHDDNNPSIADDSTEVMLDKARLLSNNTRNQDKVPTSTYHHDQNINFTSPPGNHQQQSIATSRYATKTPKVTPPTSDDEFYTPSTSDKPDREQYYDMIPRLSSSVPCPMALTFDVAVGTSEGVKRGLTPVWEDDDEGKAEEEDDIQSSKVDWDDVLEHIQSLEMDYSSVDMKEFRTPKQQGMDRQMNDYDTDGYDDDDDEEFFSPLVLHSGHTPSNQQYGYNSNPNMMNSVQSSLTALDFNNEPMIEDNINQFPASNRELPTSSVPHESSEVAAKIDYTPSLGYADVKQDLQSLLKEAKILSPPDKSRYLPVSNPSNVPPSPTPQLSMDLGYSHDNSYVQSPTSFHLHSPSVSDLPKEALTVDFVKSCDNTKQLQAILGLLSDDNTCATHKNIGKRGKQLRYPSLARLVEKRLQKLLLKEQDELAKLVNERSGGADKENVDPLTLRNQEKGGSAYDNARENIFPVDCVTVLNDSNEAGAKNYESTNQNGSPSAANESTSMSKSSLDMNLSESIMLEDESFYWKQGADHADDNIKNDNSNHGLAAAQRRDMDTQTHESDEIFDSYEEFKDQLASTIASNARLAEEMNYVAKEQRGVETRLSTNLERMTEQFQQHHNADTTDNRLHQIQIAEFEKINHTLREEIQRLREQIHLLNQSAEGTTRQLQSELEEARHQQSRLFQDKEKVCRELDEIRSMYDKAQREIARLKLLLDKKNEGEDAEKIQRVVESAKLANKALANALAVSEKDLADACAAKEKSERECNALRDRSNKLEDKTSFLLSEVKKVTEELSSSHAYIDKLYAGLEASRMRSQEIMNDFQRRENEWMESKRGFSQRIEELENQIGSDSQHKVSMDAYLSVVKQTRYYKFESMKSQQTINLLKDQLEDVRKSSVAKRDSSQRVPTVIETSRQSVPINDENVVNSTRVEQIDQRSQKNDVAGMHQQQGKQLSRIAVVRAAGGRKGLSEQLKKARRFGEKQVS
ncbi:hypothetical protein ACHAWU_006042 [Discostella pseudostelligera]|uniref:Uncharacterized protein n=1 Tax=Discostella pseudostelligera TaxID=259834 RepID=A0ABD3M1W6_9STRA